MSQLAIIEQSLRELQPRFEDVAVDRSINFNREVEFAMQVMVANDYVVKIAADSMQSLLDAVTNVSAIGISLNPAKKQAYLVPRKGRICLDISYMGLIDMAVAGGAIRFAQAVIVHQDDKFALNGYDKAPTHTYEPFSATRGPIVGAYAVVKTASGDFLTHCMTIGDVYAIRNRSESYKSGKASPWKTDECEMIKKTVIKQACKYWPKSERLEQAIQYLNTEGGEGLEPIIDQPEPEGAVTGRKPTVEMPEKRPAAPSGDVTDVEPKETQEKPATARSGASASIGEVAFIKKKIAAKGISISDARSSAGLDACDHLDDLTVDGFIAMKDALK